MSKVRKKCVNHTEKRAAAAIQKLPEPNLGKRLICFPEHGSGIFSIASFYDRRPGDNISWPGHLNPVMLFAQQLPEKR